VPITSTRRPRPRLALMVLCGALIALAACSSSGSKSASTTTASQTADSKANPCGTWETQYVGQPKATKTAEQAGYFVWTDVGGWHLRVRDAKGGTYSGTVTSSKDIQSAKANPDGSGTVSLAANQITFEFKGTKDLIGFDLAPGCVPPPDLQLRFNLQVNGSPADTATIFTGANSKAVASTFTAVRSKN
jgi:hypothetical protein